MPILPAMRSSSKAFFTFLNPWRWLRSVWGCVSLSYLVLVILFTGITPPPSAVGLHFDAREARNVLFLADISSVDGQGERKLDQRIFDAVVEQIDSAFSTIVVDMFLFNDWQGPEPETHRALAAELTNALVARKLKSPDVDIVVISDPVNTVYDGIASKHFDALRAANITVIVTDLTELQDSNPLYSGLWRWLIRPFGNSNSNLLPNPLGPGRVSVRSYLALLNFKANHRKLLITDTADGEFTAMVMSANPHDGSSAHRNVALQFSGESAKDLLLAELALLELNGATDVFENLLADLSIKWPIEPQKKSAGEFLVELDSEDKSVATTRIVNESQIERSAIEMLSRAEAGESVDLLMFYLSDRHIVNALVDAAERGVNLRVLLDVNKDAFGRQKNGVPNLPVAQELMQAGVTVRWCLTLGEQCHAKMLLASYPGRSALLLGSGNYTRRNMEDFNLESNVLYSATANSPVISDAMDYFNVQWQNSADQTYSASYEEFAKDQWWLMPQYRFMEFTGIGTF